MQNAAQVIQEALACVKVVDPHCHLRLAKPSANSLANIVLYHHVWIELVSAGLDAREVMKGGLPHELTDPGLPPLLRVRKCLPYLPRIQNTTLGLYLRWILEDLYGIAGGVLDENNLEAAARLVEEKGRDPSWEEEVLRRRCGIEVSLSVARDGAPPSARFGRGLEWAPVNLAKSKQTPREVLAWFESQFRREIRTAQDYREFLNKGAERLPASEIKFLGLWLTSGLTPELSREEDVSRTLAKVREGAPLSAAESGGFCYFGVTELLAALRRTPLRTLQVIVGAEVLPPHRSITAWNHTYAPALARLAGAFEDFHFNTSSASDLYTQDLGILAKHIPNISVAGYWWHTLYPFYIRKSIETRIDMVPLNKIVAYLSDAYHIEWCYPKLKMVKALWGEVLLERVEKDWCRLDTALALIQNAFYENPKRIYGVSSPT